MEYPETTDDFFAVIVIKQEVTKVHERTKFSCPLEQILTSKELEEDAEDEDLAKLMAWLDNQTSSSTTTYEQPEPLLELQEV